MTSGHGKRSAEDMFRAYAERYYDQQAANCASTIVFEAGLAAGDRLKPLHHSFLTDNDDPDWREMSRNGKIGRARKAAELIAHVPEWHRVSKCGDEIKSMPLTLAVLWEHLFEGLFEASRPGRLEPANVRQFLTALTARRQCSTPESAARKKIFSEQLKASLHMDTVDVLGRALVRIMPTKPDMDIVRMFLRNMILKGSDAVMIEIIQSLDEK